MKHLTVIALLLLVGMSCNQEPIPLNPTPGFPCGTGWYFECSGGGCCGRGERCGEKGHACNEHECCFDGDDQLWATERNGGDAGTRQRPQGVHSGPKLTYEQARKAGPR